MLISRSHSVLMLQHTARLPYYSQVLAFMKKPSLRNFYLRMTKLFDYGKKLYLYFSIAFFIKIIVFFSYVTSFLDEKEITTDFAS